MQKIRNNYTDLIQKLIFINSLLVTDLTRPRHSTVWVWTLSCGLLGLCTLSYKAFSYSMTQRLNLTLKSSTMILFHDH